MKYHRILKATSERDFVLPRSKSETARALILQALLKHTHNETLIIKDASTSTDSEDLKRNLALLLKGEREFFLGDGGTTTRFFLALLLRFQGQFLIHLSDQMSTRPLRDLYDIITDLGGKVHQNDKRLHLEISNILFPKELVVSCKKTTQFASALMLATSDLDLLVKPVDLFSSQGHLDLTCKMVAEYQRGKRDFSISLDLASASYPIAYGAVIKSALIQNLAPQHREGPERELFHILDLFGVNYSFTDQGLKVFPSSLKAIDYDFSGALDLVPTAIFLATFATGESHFRGLENLKVKESDRLEEMVKLLKRLNISHHLTDSSSGLSICGVPHLESDFFSYDPPFDHRIVMVTMLYMAKLSGGELSHVEAISKSYRDFERYFQA